MLIQMVAKVAQQLHENIRDSGLAYECMTLIVKGDDKYQIYDVIEDTLGRLNDMNPNGSYILSIGDIDDDNDEFEIVIDEKKILMLLVMNCMRKMKQLLLKIWKILFVMLIKQNNTNYIYNQFLQHT